MRSRCSTTEVSRSACPRPNSPKQLPGKPNLSSPASPEFCHDEIFVRPGLTSDILELTSEHIVLVLSAMSIAIALGVPAGILLTRRAAWRSPVLTVANILQTIPSLALFGFLIPLPLLGGIGPRTAIFALVLYALLPIIRNTLTGILGVDPAVRESAVAMGLTARQVLRQVELPLAARTILAGI